MRNFNVLTVLSAALLMGGGAFAKEKAEQPKPRKICRTQEMPGRITPRRICRVVPPSDSAAQDRPRKAADPRESDSDRD